MLNFFRSADDLSNDQGWFVGDFALYAETAPALTTTAPEVSTVPAPTASVATSTHPSAYSVLGDMIAHESGGYLLYGGALAVLKDAIGQGMSADLFAQLQAASKTINATGGISMAPYVQQIFDDVTLGNSANAHWTNGATSSSALGNLSATSNTFQLRELMNKWFLGNDLPGAAGAPGASTDGIAYQTYSLPLFSRGGPKLTDVNQGQVGDCWFLAAAAETAMLDPSLIQDMFLQHGNGTFKVEFWVNGKPDFVTLNAALPTYTDGSMQFGGSTMSYANSITNLWVPLLEKGAAELSEQSGVVTGVEYAGGQNQYFDLTGGGGEGITLLTGQSTATYAIGGLSTSAINALLGQMHNALSTGHDVLLGTSGQSVGGDLVASHMFAVTGIDAAGGTVNLYNPWGANAAGDGKDASFTIATSALAADGADFYAALGVAKAA